MCHNTGQLDLSKFDHITPAEDDADLQRQSKSLANVIQMAEQFIKVLRIYVEGLQSVDGRARVMEMQEQYTRDREYELVRKERQAQVLLEEAQRAKEYAEKATAALTTREKALEEQKEYLSEIEEAKKDWEARKAEALKKEHEVDKKIAELKLLTKKQ